MRLPTWVKARGYGEISRLARETGLSYQAVHRLVSDPARRATGRSAALISKATDGAVSIEELVTSANDARRATRRVRKKRKRAPKRAERKQAA